MTSLLSPTAFCSITYDYVIAGAGTAGLALANRLSEDPKINVAVLEAGQNHIDDPQVLTPGLATSLSGNDSYDWIFQTTPQIHLDGRIFGHPRGKQLGGSSAINAMFWTHASQADINDWEILGNKGWNWKSLLPYFLESETYVAPTPQTAKDLDTNFKFDPSVHGEHGPVINSFPEFHGPFQEAWWQTYKGLGLGLNGDPKGGLALGGFTNPTSVDPKTRTRTHSGVAYYKPIAARSNLYVLTGALVEKVTFDHQSHRKPHVATGIKFSVEGTSHVVKAKREVILSAGAFGSPKILELSGIGSAEVLNQNKIKLIYENENVGENLQDHMLVPLSFEAADGQFTLDALRDPAVFNAALALYAANRTGVLSAGTCSSALLSYQQILPAHEKGKIPKGLDHVLTPRQKARNPGLACQHELTVKKTLNPQEATTQHVTVPGGSTPSEVLSFAKFFGTTLPGSFYTLAAILEHPFSRGSVHINNSDPAVYPLIDPGYLSAEVDLEIFADIMLHLQSIARAEPLASLLKNKGRAFQPGYVELTTSNVRDHVKKTMGTEYHPCCTSTMSPRHRGGVVNERLRVYGTKNVRVVDASIFPLQVRANLQTLVYAVAEKAADMIKEDRVHTGHDNFTDPFWS